LSSENIFGIFYIVSLYSLYFIYPQRKEGEGKRGGRRGEGEREGGNIVIPNAI